MLSQTRQSLLPNVGHMIIVGVSRGPHTSSLHTNTWKYEHLYFYLIGTVQTQLDPTPSPLSNPPNTFSSSPWHVPWYLLIVGAIKQPRPVRISSDINTPSSLLFFPEGLPCITHHRCMYKDCFLLLKAVNMHAQLPVQRAVFFPYFSTFHSLFPSSAFHPRPQQTQTVDN